MSHVYVVVATRDSEVEVCETFSGVQSALGRAFQVASDKSGRGRTDLFNHSPGEETLPDGSVRWVFMETSKQSVVVFYRKIEDALLDSKDPNNVIGGLPNTKTISKDVVPVSNSLHGSLGQIRDQIKDHMAKERLTWPARGTLEGTPIHGTPRDIKEDFKWIDASKYIKDGLPYGAGGNLAKALLDLHLTRKDWDSLVIDVTSLPTDLVISSFFNAFLQMISDHDSNLLDLVKNSAWMANYDFQYQNIERWMEEFKPLPPPFNFMDRTLPAGWNVDDKPILMGQLLDNPDSIKDPLLESTEEQKWALVKARIRKSPHFAIIPDGLSGYVPSRNDALKAVEDRSDLGVRIRNADIQRLHDLWLELLNGSLKSL